MEWQTITQGPWLSGWGNPLASQPASQPSQNPAFVFLELQVKMKDIFFKLTSQLSGLSRASQTSNTTRSTSTQRSRSHGPTPTSLATWMRRVFQWTTHLTVRSVAVPPVGNDLSGRCTVGICNKDKIDSKACHCPKNNQKQQQQQQQIIYSCVEKNQEKMLTYSYKSFLGDTRTCG